MRDQAPTSCFAPLAFGRPSIPPAGSGAPTIGWKTKWAVLARSLAGVSSARAAASIGSPGLSVRDDTETRAAASGLGILRGFDSRRLRLLRGAAPATHSRSWLRRVGCPELALSAAAGRGGEARPAGGPPLRVCDDRYETGSNPNFSAGSQSRSKDVIVNVSVSNWFMTPNDVASVRCGPLMS
jgi:hypothetical protein